jgi:hypothetical protein
MALETIGLGTTANDGTGDDLRTAGAKINAAIEALDDAIDALDDRIVRVVHGSTADTARPEDAVYVEWVGSVEPDNAAENDTWVDTSA